VDVIPETSAVERCYREQGDRLWRAVFAFTADADVASDAVMEAFAQLLRRGDEVRDPNRWVWRAAFRIAAGELQERRRSAPTVDHGTYEIEGSARELVDALQRLSPKQRTAVVLHHAAGYPLREVATILGSTPGAVKVHLLRGRRRLRELLQEEEA
jgi:RNA polymerase sigma factor (sigma-70 family)